MLNWKQIFMTKSLPQSPESFPFLVLGNKYDLEDQRRVSTLDARKFCQQNGNMTFFEASAKTNTNVEEAFKAMGKLALQRQKELNPEKKTASGNQNEVSRMQLNAKNAKL